MWQKYIKPEWSWAIRAEATSFLKRCPEVIKNTGWLSRQLTITFTTKCKRTDHPFLLWAKTKSPRCGPQGPPPSAPTTSLLSLPTTLPCSPCEISADCSSSLRRAGPVLPQGLWPLLCPKALPPDTLLHLCHDVISWKSPSLTVLSKTAPHAMYSHSTHPPIFVALRVTFWLTTCSLFLYYFPIYNISSSRVGTSFVLFITVFPARRVLPKQNSCSINICAINQRIKTVSN